MSEPGGLVRSDAESSRFGLEVARMTIDDRRDGVEAEVLGALERSEADVVVLRYPSHWVDLFGRLMASKSHVPLFADCLMYWECSLPSEGATPPAGVDRAWSPVDEIEGLVRDVFDGYGNHYAANPLFDRAAALDGYVEWAMGLVGSGGARCLTVRDDDGVAVGFSLIDFAVATPEVRLAGIRPSHRGVGWYRSLMLESMRSVTEAGFGAISISTQSHNVAVMSTWAKLGWVPVGSMLTVHLVRHGLFAAQGS